MANIKLVVKPIAVPNDVLIIVEKVSDLGTEITRSAPLPTDVQQNLTFPDLDPVMYRFFFWETVDGVTLSSLVGSADIDGSLAFDFLVEIFEVEVDGAGDNDPVSGQAEYRNPELLNCDILTPGVVPTGPVYTVEQRAIGRKKVAELVNVPDPGGFDLNGDNFYGGDIYFITKYSRVLAAAPPSAGGNPSDVVTITDQVTSMLAGNYGKALEFFSALDTMTLQIDLTAVPDKKQIVINTHRFTGNYLVLDFIAGGMYYKGAEVTKFYMPAGEELSLIIKGHKARIIFYPGNAGQRGMPVYGYKLVPGYKSAIGTTLTKTQAPGLYKFVEDLPVGAACTFTQRAEDTLIDGVNYKIYRACWAIDAGTESIMLPDLRDLSFKGLMMADDVERLVNQPGGYQHFKTSMKGVKVGIREGNGGNATGAISATGFSGQDNPTGWITENTSTQQHIRFNNAADGFAGGLAADVTRDANAGFIPLITL